MKVYQRIAELLIAIDNCENAGNWEWRDRHRETLYSIVRDGPSGSGFDNGTKLGDDSAPNRLVFDTAFHHMDEHGSYDGWTEHRVIVSPSLAFGFCVRVTGRDRNEIKDYISIVFNEWLEGECTQ